MFAKESIYTFVCVNDIFLYHNEHNRKIKDDKLKRKSLFYDLNHIRELCFTLKGTKCYIVLLVLQNALTVSVKNKILYEKQADSHRHCIIAAAEICAKSVERAGRILANYYIFNTSFFIILLYYHEKGMIKYTNGYHLQKSLWEILRNVSLHSDFSKERVVWKFRLYAFSGGLACIQLAVFYVTLIPIVFKSLKIQSIGLFKFE